MLKRLCFVVLITTLFVQCSPEEDRIRFEIMPFLNIEFPETLEFGETYDIVYTYKRPTSCHGHDGIIFNAQGNMRILHIQNIVLLRDDCEAIENQILERTFKLQVSQQEDYIFKYYVGKDDEENLLYEQITVPVE